MGKLASVGSEKREEKRRMWGCVDAETENVSDTAEDKGGERATDRDLPFLPSLRIDGRVERETARTSVRPPEMGSRM